MRLFIAIDIEDAIRDRIAEYVARMKQRGVAAKFVSKASYHITLKFLGETDRKTEIVNSLREVQGAALELSLRGVGFFPHERSPRVFWAGIEAGDELRRLAREISTAMAGLGFKEEGAFKPHLTLARAGSGNPHQGTRGAGPAFARLREVIASEAAPEFGTMTAREYFLFESRLKPSGAEYFKLEKFELASR